MKNLLIAGAVMVLTAGSAMAQTVRLGTEGAYPPYNIINDAGQVDGFERDVGDLICELAALNCEWVTTDWDSIIPNLQSGNYDSILAGMSITPERLAVIDFSDPYFPPAASSYMSADADIDLSSAIVAAQVNTIQAAHVAESGATLVEFATPDEAVAAMRNGEADAVFADRDFLLPISKESNGQYLMVGEDVAIGSGIGIGLRKSDTELKEKLNAQIAVIKADGRLNALIVKWFGEDALVF